MVTVFNIIYGRGGGEIFWIYLPIIIINIKISMPYIYIAESILAKIDSGTLTEK